MDAVRQMGEIIKKAAELTKDQNGLACAKLVVFCNPVEDNPFMAGAFHGTGEGEAVINVGVSGPGVVLNALKRYPDADLGEVAEIIKKTAFKITRAGELIGRVVAERLNVPFNLDLSLAPTNAMNDSVAEILKNRRGTGRHPWNDRRSGVDERCREKGGAKASSYVGGLSGHLFPSAKTTA